MYAVERYVRECGLDRRLLELVKLRASQVNGCAYCVDMHTKDARANGETEQRLYAVVVWREAPFLHRTGARGAGLDRGPHVGEPGASSGQCLRNSTQRVQR